MRQHTYGRTLVCASNHDPPLSAVVPCIAPFSRWDAFCCFFPAPQTRAVTIVVFRMMHLSDILSPSFWAQIWIDYARFDPAYADSRSAGYNIDVGNGHSTLAPTLFLMASMVRPLLGAKVSILVERYYTTSVCVCRHLLRRANLENQMLLSIGGQARRVPRQIALFFCVFFPSLLDRPSPVGSVW